MQNIRLHTIRNSWLLLVTVLLNFTSLSAQNGGIRNIDSLKNRLSEEVSEKKRGELILEIANSYKISNDFVNAINYYKEAQFVFKSINDSRNLGNTYKAIGDIYAIINDYTNAIENYQEAFYIYDDANLAEEKANLSLDFSNVFLKLEKYNMAIQYLQKSKGFLQKTPDGSSEKLIKLYIMLGSAFGYKEQLDSSLLYFENAMHVSRNLDDKVQLGGVLNNIGAIYSKKNQLDSALYYYNEALALFENIHLEKGVAVTISNIAYLRKKENKFQEAIKLYNNSIELFQKTNELGYLKDAYLNMSDIYSAQNNYKESLHYLQLFQQINDSLMNANELGKITSLEMQYNIRKRDNEFQKLQQKNELIEKDNSIKKKILFVLVIGIVLVIIIAALLLRNMRASVKNTQLKQLISEKEKEHLNKELEYQKKELENFAFRIIEKNNFLESLKEQITDLKTNSDSKTIKDITSSMNQNLDIDKDLKEFDLKAEEIHKHFFHILQEKYPDLTKTDRKLCSLILIGVGSKEIAGILNISQDGVKKARYRLRKKFNLEPEADIHSFLKTLT